MIEQESKKYYQFHRKNGAKSFNSVRRLTKNKRGPKTLTKSMVKNNLKASIVPKSEVSLEAEKENTLRKPVRKQSMVRKKTMAF